MISQRIVACIMFALASVFLNSCAKENLPPLRLASSTWPGYEPIYLPEI